MRRGSVVQRDPSETFSQYKDDINSRKRLPRVFVRTDLYLKIRRQFYRTAYKRRKRATMRNLGAQTGRTDPVG